MHHGVDIAKLWLLNMLRPLSNLQRKSLRLNWPKLMPLSRQNWQRNMKYVATQPSNSSGTANLQTTKVSFNGQHCNVNSIASLNPSTSCSVCSVKLPFILIMVFIKVAAQELTSLTGWTRRLAHQPNNLTLLMTAKLLSKRPMSWLLVSSR